VPDGPAAAAAIAALQKLQSLKLVDVWAAEPNRPLLEPLQLPQQLTHFSFDHTGWGFVNAEEIVGNPTAVLSQLSGLVKLEHLKFKGVTHNSLPGRLPSQLVKLTSLDVSYFTDCNTAEQLQHLSASQHNSSCQCRAASNWKQAIYGGCSTFHI
jgi:hypothetical protein